MKITSYLHTLFQVFLFACLCGMPGIGLAEELIVEQTLTDPAHYTTIQAAIDYANTRITSDPTGTSYSILVKPGTYQGDITLRNSIPVRGQETMRTFVNGGASGVAMSADGVTGLVAVRNLTFLNATTGIAVSNNSAIEITNNVFIGSSGTAIQVTGSASTQIINNTFYQNAAAVSGGLENVKVINNIFSGNTQNIVPSPALASQLNISNNDFDPVIGDVIGSAYLPNDTYLDPDPLFVAPDAEVPDFHLKSGSPCIDTGPTSISDPYSIPTVTTSIYSDIGAYGGTDADTVPAMVTGITSTATTAAPYVITLSWTSSTNYLVGGYRVHYGNLSGTYNGSDAKDESGNPLVSPVDVGTATTLSLNDLTPATTTPEAPVLNTPQPLNGSLVVSWSAVSGATSYNVQYGMVSVSENQLSVVGANSATIGGLVNGQSYKVAVSAVAQTTYYVSVTAYDASGQTTDPGKSHESAYSVEFPATIGPKNESGLSNEVVGLPEIISAYPVLPNSGCFIATAAYGSPEAGPVRILRSFRDRYLLVTEPGKAFVRWYYAVSPGLAAFVNEHPALKPLVRALLAPVVAVAAAATAPLFPQFLILLAAGGIAVAIFFRGNRRSIKNGGSITPS